MSLKKDLQESLKDPRPLYAMVGATDLVVEKLRDAGTKAAHDAPHLKDIEDKAVGDATRVVRGVRRVPSIALNQTLDALVRAHEQYEGLAERGSKVVKDQRGASNLVHEAEEHTRELADKASGYKEKAEKYVDDYRDKAEKYVDEYKEKAEKYVDKYTDKANKYVDEYKGKAEKYVDEAKEVAEKYTGDWGHKADDAAHKANDMAHKAASDARGRAKDVMKSVRTEADHLRDVVMHPTQRGGVTPVKTQVAKASKPAPRRRRVPMPTEETGARPMKRTASATKGAAAPTMAGPAKKPTTPRKRVAAKATASASPVAPKTVEVEVKTEA